ncbi:unnamed protein product [Protopolystoma xenopodis]|uniref:Uncharacterized protein n=1 Tax=Protopolystoma xenopodis TaxID=117903 RepID=A0A3S5A921_9PLAT|nr:unnamed protein product [Protopolystoma xenopodis]
MLSFTDREKKIEELTSNLSKSQAELLELRTLDGIVVRQYEQISSRYAMLNSEREKSKNFLRTMLEYLKQLVPVGYSF